MENLGIDVKLLLAQLVNFGLFFFLFKKFLSAPFLKFLQQERKKEEEKQKTLAAIKKQEEEMENMEKDMRAKAKKHIDEMLAEAKENAETVRQEIIAQAEREAVQIIEKAKAQVDEERTALYKEVKAKAVDLAMLLVNNALKEYLTEDAKRAVTQHIVHHVAKEVN